MVFKKNRWRFSFVPLQKKMGTDILMRIISIFPSISSLKEQISDPFLYDEIERIESITNSILYQKYESSIFQK